MWVIVALMILMMTQSPALSKTFDSVPPGFIVYQVNKGDTWESLFPQEDWRELAKRVNRMNVKLAKSQTILAPQSKEAFLYTPVPFTINSSAPRELVFFLNEQYFGAYEYGELIHWGPISSGKYGNTPTGNYRAQSKQEKKYSSKYQGSRMFFAVQFSGNFFSHEQILPGVPASKGCIRMLWEDAKWKFDWIKIGDSIKIVRSVTSL